MLVQLTNAGAALLNANAGPIQLSTAKLGSAFGYVPDPADTNIHGSLLYTGAPSQFFVVNANVVKYSVYLDYNLGPFSFGELGLYTSTGVLFALAANDELLDKVAIAAGATGNSIRLDIYLSMVGQNYEMWLDYASSSNQFQMAILGSVDSLPPPKNATPNAYVITGGTNQSSFLAYTDRSGLWQFDAYAYANQATASIQAFDSQSVTINLGDYVAGMAPEYIGQVIAEFSSGALYGICRYVSSCVISGSAVTLGFDNPLMQTPVVGDKITVFARQALSTTIPNLPIATASSLGGVKIGPTLVVTADGTVNVAPTSYPVTSVNNKSGVVVLTASDISGFAAVATSGNYNDLANKPTSYALPVATNTVLGGVKAPSDTNLTIAGDGTIDLNFSPVKSVNGSVPDPSTGNVVVTFNSIGLVAPAQIASGADLNQYQTTGLFFVLDADSPTVLNGPGNPTGRKGAVVEIEPFTVTATGGDVIQRWTESARIFFRRYTQSSNTWSTWVSVTTLLPVATTSALGVVSAGAGLNVTPAGVLSTQIQTINGKSDQFTVLTSDDVNAISKTVIDKQGGVPSLSLSPNIPALPTDVFDYGRLDFHANTLGTWWSAGSWDASANHVAQTGAADLSVVDTNTSLLASGMQLIDISYNGAVSDSTVPDYQTVSAEGMVYKVIVAGTTSLDGINTWNVGDFAVAVNGKWSRIALTKLTPAPLLINGANTVKGGGTIAAGANTTLNLAVTCPANVTAIGFLSVNYESGTAGIVADCRIDLTNTTTTVDGFNESIYTGGVTIWSAVTGSLGDSITVQGTITAQATAITVDAYMGYFMFATG